MVRLVHDPGNIRTLAEWTTQSQISQQWDGFAHAIYGTSRKATRVSHSTSHGEALTQLGTIQIAQLVSNRLTEPYHKMLLKQPVFRPLDGLSMQYQNIVLVPIDSLTDCMDVWELVNNRKGLANDKTQRLVVLGLREYKQLGIIRCFAHCPTRVMPADGLTKVGTFSQLLKLVTTGRLQFQDWRQQVKQQQPQPEMYFRIATSQKASLEDRIIE